MNTRFHWTRVSLGCAVGCLWSSLAWAQFGGSLTVRVADPINDVIGRQLADGSARVEILRAYTPPGFPDLHLNYAPDQTTGEPHEFNPLKRESHIGAGMLSGNSGRFSETFDERLQGDFCFVRVFDQMEPGSSLYYIDSEPFPDDGNATSVNVDFSISEWKLISTSAPDVDTDGDGIPDMLEIEEFGTSVYDADTDGDGWDDLFEVLHSDYLDPTADNSLIVNLHRADAGEEGDPGPTDMEEAVYSVNWWTFPVPEYVLEFHPYQVDAPDDPETGYVELWRGSVDEGVDEVHFDIDWVLEESPTGFFRVRAILP